MRTLYTSIAETIQLQLWPVVCKHILTQSFCLWTTLNGELLQMYAINSEGIIQSIRNLVCSYCATFYTGFTCVACLSSILMIYLLYLIESNIVQSRIIEAVLYDV